MAFNDMARGGNPFGKSDWSDGSDGDRGNGSGLRTPLIDQERGGGGRRGGGLSGAGGRTERWDGGSYDTAIAELGRSIGTFQKHINATATLSKRVGTPRDSRKVRDQIHSHIDEGRALTSAIMTSLKDFNRYLSEVGGSERVSWHPASLKRFGIERIP